MRHVATAQIAIPVPLKTLFHYGVPIGLADGLEVGQRVWVPFGRRGVTGYVVEYPSTPPAGVSLKNISKILDGEVSTFTPSMVAFLLWLAGYYHASPGEVFRGAHPAGTNERSVPGLTLGPESHQIPLGLDGTDELTQILKQIRDYGRPIPIRELTVASNERLLRTWVNRGLLERVPVVVDARVSTKTVRAYRALRVAPTEPRGRGGKHLKRDEIHRWLVGRGTVPIGTISETFPRANSHLRHLLEENAVVLEVVEVRRDPFALDSVDTDEPPVLNEAQRRAVYRINDTSTYEGFLLHGITGSGKTEVYLRVIAQGLSQGRGAIVLVPEIALTPQLVRRFRARLGDCIAVLHSGLSEGERYDEWRRIRRGDVAVVIGARSAIFAPVVNLGIIVVDEEHDGSFKQGDGVRYHGRDMALVRGHRENVPVVLGSATPSLESLHNAQTGKLTLLNLPNRATGGRLPDVELIDLKTVESPDDGLRFLSKPVRDAIAGSLSRGEQSIIFLNRRGFSSFVLCTECGDVIDCHRCAISMTWHKARQRLHCHYCDAARPLPPKCPSCHSPNLQLSGRGTERIEESLAHLFPNARISRLDRDTSGGRGLETVIRGMRERSIDILVGTQMVTKGHDFPYVTTVAILDADAGLNFPDFRAAERTFQLLTQVAGRAGRAQRPGRVLVQSYEPEHYALQALLSHDHVSFSQAELGFRKESRYPPFSHAATIRVDGKKPGEVESVIRGFSDELTQAAMKTQLMIRGPAPAALERLRGRTRWALLVTAKERGQLHSALGLLTLDPKSLPSDIRVAIDVDPYDLL